MLSSIIFELLLEAVRAFHHTDPQVAMRDSRESTMARMLVSSSVLI
jgi:hypothetical protein